MSAIKFATLKLTVQNSKDNVLCKIVGEKVELAGLVRFDISNLDEAEYIFDVFMFEIAAKLQLKSFTLTYKDDEGDEIMLDTTIAFREYIKIIEKSESKVGMLTISSVKELSPKRVTFDEAPIVCPPPVPLRSSVPGPLCPPMIRRRKLSSGGVASESASVAIQITSPTEPQAIEKPPKWFIAYSEQLKKDLFQTVENCLSKSGPAVKNQESITESQMNVAIENALAIDCSNGRLCHHCQTAISGSYFVCLHPSCGLVSFCAACERCGKHSTGHILLKKPLVNMSAEGGAAAAVVVGSKNKIDQWYQRKAEKHIEKLEHKLKKYSDKRAEHLSKYEQKKARRNLDPAVAVKVVKPISDKEKISSDKVNFGAEFLSQSDTNDIVIGSCESVTHVWRVKNVGTAEWTTDNVSARIVATKVKPNFLSQPTVNLPVKPDSETEITFTFAVPSQPMKIYVAVQLYTGNTAFSEPLVYTNSVVAPKDEREQPLKSFLFYSAALTPPDVGCIQLEDHASKTPIHAATPNNTPLIVTPAASHPHTPRCVSPTMNAKSVIEGTAIGVASQKIVEEPDLRASDVRDALLLSVEQQSRAEAAIGTNQEAPDDDEENASDDDSYSQCSMPSDDISCAEIDFEMLPVCHQVALEEMAAVEETFAIVRGPEDEIFVGEVPAVDIETATMDETKRLIANYSEVTSVDSALETSTTGDLLSGGIVEQTEVINPCAGLLDSSVHETLTVGGVTPLVPVPATATAAIEQPEEESEYFHDAVHEVAESLDSFSPPPKPISPASASPPVVSREVSQEMLAAQNASNTDEANRKQNDARASVSTASLVECLVQSAATGVKTFFTALDSLANASSPPAFEQPSQQASAASSVMRQSDEPVAVTASSWTPPQPWTAPHNPEQVLYKDQEEMWRLFEMGFCNRELNRRLLQKFGNNLESVISELIESASGNRLSLD